MKIEGMSVCDMPSCGKQAVVNDRGVDLCESHQHWGNCAFAEDIRKRRYAQIVAVSGGYDPIHIGHLRNIQEAAKLGNRLMVILTRDDQLIEKKGYVFMPYAERKEILEGIKGVHMVVENIDQDRTCNLSLRQYKPDIFAKGGDTWDAMNLPEAETCTNLGINMMFGIGGIEKVQSSSLLTRNENKKAMQIVQVLLRKAFELAIEKDLKDTEMEGSKDGFKYREL